MKKFNSLLFFTSVLVLLTQNLFSQESDKPKIKEIYLTGNLLTFNFFGSQYKSELKNGNFLRIGMTDIHSEVRKQNYALPMTGLPYTSTEISGIFEIGLEKRKQITDKLFAFYGVNFVVSSNFHRNKRQDVSLPLESRRLDDYSINPGFGFNSGLIYSISDEFLISAELTPRLLYHYSTSQRVTGLDKVNDTSHAISFDLDNQSIRVSVIYKWNK